MTAQTASPLEMPACLEGLPIVKMEGAGNDFVVLDGRFRDLTEVLTPTPLRWLADRQFGVGADQILVLDHQHGPEADFRYRIFNADGHEVSQCGNGARCFARYVFERGLAEGPTMRVLTASGVILPRLLESGEIEVDMGAPRFLPADLPMEVGGLRHISEGDLLQVELPLEAGWPAEWSRPWSLVSMGNPHLVAWWDDLDDAALDQAVQTLGPWLQAHPRLPERVNVGFAQRIDEGQIRLRVYERGSGETLACGTGACAAAVAGMAAGLLDRQQPVSVQMRGGVLTIRWSPVAADQTEAVWLGGPARTVFEGRLSSPPTVQRNHRQIQAGELRALLADYPQVFMENPDLLAGLDLRHPHTGTVVSLLERQTQVLRDQLRQQQSRLGLLIGHAQENDVIQSRLFAWARAILMVPADARAVTLRESLAAIFQMPVVELLLWPVGLHGEELDEIPPAEAVLRTFLSGMSRPACVSALSEPGRAALACMADPQATADLGRGSMAILPLRRGLRPVVEGALILATPDSGRFGPDHGLVYLEQIAELSSAALLPGQGLLELAIDPDGPPTLHA